VGGGLFVGSLALGNPDQNFTGTSGPTAFAYEAVGAGGLLTLGAILTTLAIHYWLRDPYPDPTARIRAPYDFPDTEAAGGVTSAPAPPRR
jgi:hypothetical protein